MHLPHMYAARHVLASAGGTASHATAPADGADAPAQPDAPHRPDSEAAWLANICRGGDVELVFRSNSNNRSSNGTSRSASAATEAEQHSAAGTTTAPQQRHAFAQRQQASTSCSSSATPQPQCTQQQASAASTCLPHERGRLRVHGAILSLCSHVLAGMMEDMQGAAGYVPVDTILAVHRPAHRVYRRRSQKMPRDTVCGEHRLDFSSQPVWTVHLSFAARSSTGIVLSGSPNKMYYTCLTGLFWSWLWMTLRRGGGRCCRCCTPA